MTTEVYFKWREQGGSWSNTTAQTVTESKDFDEDLPGLDTEKNAYEFQAVVEADGTVYEGDVLFFTARYAYFDYRIKNTSDWVATEAITDVEQGSEPFDFDLVVQDLEPETEYEFRGVYKEFNDVDYGSVKEIETEALKALQSSLRLSLGLNL